MRLECDKSKKMRVILRVQMRESLQVHVVNFTVLVRCNDNVVLYKSKMVCRSVQGRDKQADLNGFLKSPPILCFPSVQDVSSIAQTRRPLLLH